MNNLNRLIENFSSEELIEFCRNKINTFRTEEESYDFLFEDKYNTKFENITKIGEAILSNSEDIVIICGKVNEELSSKSGKKNQFEIAKKILIQENKDASIFVFYDEYGSFRFSLIRVNYLGSKKDFTDFKRFTYFVSKNLTNKTFKQQIEKADFNDLDSIQEAFSVEPLTKEFYEKIQHWYFWAIKNVTFPSEPTMKTVYEKTGKNDINELEPLIQEHRAQNVIRMLTRILFVWFIKQKNLIPQEFFDLNFLQKEILNEINPYHEHLETIKEYNKESIYYKAILQNLFFATLNCPIEPNNFDNRKRGFRGDESYGKHRGVDYLMRYKKHFKKPEIFLKMVNEIVPFLNGGLFECLDNKDEDIYIDGFSDKLPEEHQLIVPDYLFFGIEEKTDLSSDLGDKNKKTKEASVMGLINILKSYNFTIDENEPNDVEVALDPELLGKVFENLLASYNPETKTTARKQTGSFYTPREIVNFMVDESLIAHLKKSVSWNLEEKELDEKLHQLFSLSSVNPFQNEEDISKKILCSFNKCKILDPACGSGAFPMGILQKIVHILRKVDPNNEHWYNIQRKKAAKETESVFKNEDKKEREQFLFEINEAFDQTVNSPDYARKLFIIENCIYGIDIQPIAIQISKLRFFISLVVEQKVNKDKENFGIRPLPNLETKFVTANTLIGIEKPKEQITIFESEKVEKLEQELKIIRHKLFGAKTMKTKRKYRTRDKELREQIANELRNNGLGNKSSQQLAKWDPYDQNSSSPFFDPEWMFDIKEGFDIVIGNPPYIQIQKFSGQQIQKDWQNEKYETFTKTGDIYTLFYEKGWQVLKDKGILCYITSNKWMRADYGKAIRRFLSNRTNPLYLIDFGGYKVFESATVDTNILIFEKDNNQNNLKAISMNKDFKKKIDFSNYIRNHYNILDNLSEESWIISTKEELSLKKKIERIGTPLRDWDISINYGIKTGYNKAFIISGEKKDELIAKDPKSAEIIKPILRGKDIKRYKAEFADLWLIASHNGYKDKNGNKIQRINIEEYPAVKDHLDKYWDKISKRYDKGDTPYNLRNCAYMEEFEKEKVVYGQFRKGEYTYNTNGSFLSSNEYLIVGNNDFFQLKLKFLLTILNSKTPYYYASLIMNSLSGNTTIAQKSIFLLTPIPIIEAEKQKPFEDLVEQILSKKEQNEHTAHLENQIDLMVYKLYELTYDEIKIVDAEFNKVLNEFGLTVEKYEKMSIEELACLDIQ